MTSLKRYFQNVFSDSEKQMAMNLFLGTHASMHAYAPPYCIFVCFFTDATGMYKPYEYDLQNSLWSLETDYYLHNPTFSRQLVWYALTIGSLQQPVLIVPSNTPWQQPKRSPTRPPPIDAPQSLFIDGHLTKTEFDEYYRCGSVILSTHFHSLIVLEK